MAIAQQHRPLRTTADAARGDALIDGEPFGRAIARDRGEDLPVVLMRRVRAQRERVLIEAECQLPQERVVGLQRSAVVARFRIARRA
jgi:hypothetical protein